jgi:hypothetical protein
MAQDMGIEYYDPRLFRIFNHSCVNLPHDLVFLRQETIRAVRIYRTIIVFSFSGIRFRWCHLLQFQL